MVLAISVAYRLRVRLVSSSRSRDIAARMDLREVLSRSYKWSRPDAGCNARVASSHTSGGVKPAEPSLRSGQESNESVPSSGAKQVKATKRKPIQRRHADFASFIQRGFGGS